MASVGGRSGTCVGGASASGHRSWVVMLGQLQITGLCSAHVCGYLVGCCSWDALGKPRLVEDRLYARVWGKIDPAQPKKKSTLSGYFI